MARSGLAHDWPSLVCGHRACAVAAVRGVIARGGTQLTDVIAAMTIKLCEGHALEESGWAGSGQGFRPGGFLPGCLGSMRALCKLKPRASLNMQAVSELHQGLVNRGKTA